MRTKIPFTISKLSTTGCPAHSSLSKKSSGRQVAATEEILRQTEAKLSGVDSIADCIVSLLDPDARVIRKGKLGKPNEFGRSMQLVQDKSDIMLDYTIHEGNPSDKAELVPMVERLERRVSLDVPTDVAADRGRYDAPDYTLKLRAWESAGSAFPRSVDYSPSRKRDSTNGGSRCSIASAAASKPASACSNVSSSFNRVRSPGNSGTRIWAGFAIFSYNLSQMA
jgi:IS5 family transposase